MSKRKAIDWEAVRVAYEAGIKTDREIARQFGVSHTGVQRKAKQGKWSKNLEARIQARAAEKVAKNAVASKGDNLATKVVTEAVIEANADVIAAAVFNQREAIDNGLETANVLERELLAALDPALRAALDEIHEEKIVEAMSSDAPAIAKKRAAALDRAYRAAMELLTRTQEAKNIAQIRDIYITQQRKVLGLEKAPERDPAGDPLERLFSALPSGLSVPQARPDGTVEYVRPTVQ